MTPEDGMLYAIFRSNYKDFNRDILKYFNSQTHQHCAMIANILKATKTEINISNATRVAYKCISYENERTDAINMLKDIYDTKGVISPPEPLYALRKAYYNKLVNDSISNLRNSKSEAEIEDIFKTGYLECTNRRDDSDMMEIRDISKDYYSSEKPAIAKISLRNDNLIKIFGQFLYGQSYGITGIPGWYKTSILIELINDVCFSGYNIGMFSFEDTKETCACKILSNNIRAKKFDVVERKVLEKNIDLALKKYKGHMYIADTSYDVNEFLEKVERNIISKNLDVVALDFSQMLKLENGQTRTDSMSRLAQGMTDIYKMYNIPFVALHQTTASNVRDVENGKRKLAGGDELGGGDIYQKARWAYYINPINKDFDTKIGTIELYCAKGENGFAGRRWYVDINGSTGSIVDVSLNDFVDNRENNA